MSQVVTDPPGDPKTPPPGEPPAGDPKGDGDGQAPPPKSSKAPDPAPGDAGIDNLEDAKKVISELRKENASHRTAKKGLESQVGAVNERLSQFETGLKKLFGGDDEKLTPEQRIEGLQAQNEQLELKSALRDAASELSVGKDSYDYFEFLVSKKLDKLKEGEDLSDEVLAECAKLANSKASNSTSVGKEGGDPPPPGNPIDGETSVEEFQLMGVVARSRLFNTNKALYEKLKTQEDAAKNKR